MTQNDLTLRDFAKIQQDLFINNKNNNRIEIEQTYLTIQQCQFHHLQILQLQ
jgi:hypothetical protein